MKRIIITGAAGFVASHFIDYLLEKRIDCYILGLDKNIPRYDLKREDEEKIKFMTVDLLDRDLLKKVVVDFRPQYILHLAAFSSVAYSWKRPSDSFLNNCNIFLNLVEVVRENIPSCRILSVGSSEEYGNVNGDKLPLGEEHLLNPISPYAVARISQELLSQIYVNAYGIDIVMTRSFNHIGPRQDDRFVVPSFINRILNIKRNGLSHGVIETGDIGIIRDFVDVRDVVKAYYILLTRGKKGEVYNVCSGKAIKLSEIIDIIAEILNVSITTRVNPEYLRPDDNREIVGSAYKIETEYGWKPEHNIRDTIHDMINERLEK